MERILSDKVSAHHYRADACMVWCFDDRFSGLLKKFIEVKGFKHVDLIKVAGGAKSLASPAGDAEKEYLLDQIAKSIKLHQTPLVVLAVHADCGTYGKSFDNNNADQEFYAGELSRAKETVESFLKQTNAGASVEKYFADFDGLSRIQSNG